MNSPGNGDNGFIVKPAPSYYNLFVTFTTTLPDWELFAEGVVSHLLHTLVAIGAQQNCVERIFVDLEIRMGPSLLKMCLDSCQLYLFAFSKN